MASHFNTNDCWEFLKGMMISAAKQVCGRIKGPNRHKETWCWNKEVSVAVSEK